MQIIVILIILLAGGAGYFYIKNTEKKKKLNTDDENQSKKIAQEFVNAQDVNENVLYTLDGMIFAFIKIDGLSLELYSNTELINLCKKCSASLSKLKFEYKYISVSRPADISKALQKYWEMYSVAEGGRRALLKQEMEELSSMIMSGETLERQHYIAIWNNSKHESEKDIVKRAGELAKAFSANEIIKIKAEILDKKGIVHLCNLVNIPAYVHIESGDVETTLTALRSAT